MTSIRFRNHFPRLYTCIQFLEGASTPEEGAPIYYYRPQRSCEGYIFTRVCLSTGGSIWAGTPQDQVHPPGTRYTSQGPGTPPKEMATVVNGMHPTRMHSFLEKMLPKLHENERNWTRGGRPSLAPPWICQWLLIVPDKLNYI